MVGNYPSAGRDLVLSGPAFLLSPLGHPSQPSVPTLALEYQEGGCPHNPRARAAPAAPVRGRDTDRQPRSTQARAPTPAPVTVFPYLLSAC